MDQEVCHVTVERICYHCWGESYQILDNLSLGTTIGLYLGPLYSAFLHLQFLFKCYRGSLLLIHTYNVVHCGETPV